MPDIDYNNLSKITSVTEAFGFRIVGHRDVPNGECHVVDQRGRLEQVFRFSNEGGDSMPKAKLSKTGKVKSKSGKVTNPNPGTKRQKVSTKADSSNRETRVSARRSSGSTGYY